MSVALMSTAFYNFKQVFLLLLLLCYIILISPVWVKVKFFCVSEFGCKSISQSFYYLFYTLHFLGSVEKLTFLNKLEHLLIYWRWMLLFFTELDWPSGVNLFMSDVSFSGVWCHRLKALLPWLNLVLLLSLKVDLFTKLHLKSVYFSFSWAPQQRERSKQFHFCCSWSECWNKKIWGESWWYWGWGEGKGGSGWCVTHGGGCAHCLCTSFVCFDIHKITVVMKKRRRRWITAACLSLPGHSDVNIHEVSASCLHSGFWQFIDGLKAKETTDKMSRVDQHILCFRPAPLHDAASSRFSPSSLRCKKKGEEKKQIKQQQNRIK